MAEAGASEVGKGLGHVATGLGHFAWDLGAVPVDFVGTSVSSRYRPHSYYGAASQHALENGQSWTTISGETGKSAITLGTYNLGMAGIDWYYNDNAAGFQETSGGFLGAALLGYAAQRTAAPSRSGIPSDPLDTAALGCENTPRSPAVPKTLPTKPPGDTYPYSKAPTSRPLSPSVEPGTYVYAQDANGVVHVMPDAPHMHPRILGGGQPAAAAGEIVIGPDRVVTEINNISGTFQHDAGVLPVVQSFVEAQGLRVAPGAIKPFKW
jgi:hypothetical protein